MAFSEGITVASMQSVVDNIVNFAVTNAGYIDEGDVVTGLPASFNTTLKRISKNGMYYYFHGAEFSNALHTESAVYCRMMRVLPTTANYITREINAQTVPSRMTVWRNLNGPFVGLNLYTDTNGIGVVLEVYDGVYAHMAFGEVDKFGTWSGGQFLFCNSIYFITGSNYQFENVNNGFVFDGGFSGNGNISNYIYRPFEPATGLQDDFSTLGASIRLGQRCKSVVLGTESANPIREVLEVSPNNATLRTTMFPVYCMFTRYSNTAEFHLQATIPLARVLNINVLSAEDIVDVEFKVFPLTAKDGDTSVYPVSGNWGVAYKRIP